MAVSPDKPRWRPGGDVGRFLVVCISAGAVALGAGSATAQLPVPPLPLTLPAPATPAGALPQFEEPLPTVAPPAVSFPIPPVAVRPLDVEEGERVFVKKFSLRGVSDRPGLGISSTELSTVLDRLRIDQQGLGDVDETGFTPDEKEQIAAFMQNVVTNPDQDMLFEDYQSLVDKLRVERLKRDSGMTIGQLQEVANAVTKYYRSAGLFLAQAFVPAQEVRDGEVVIEVIEGSLGTVLAEGNEAYSTEILARPFEDIIDAPITAAAVESRILTLSDYPGLSVFGVFQPGDEVGASDLVLRVQDESPYIANLRYDNHGTEFTGKRRIYGDFTWNNPSGVGDMAKVALLQQYQPRNSFFGSVEYERPVLTPGMTVGARYSNNPFDVGGPLRGIGIGGQSKTLDVWTRGSMLRSREENVYGEIGWTRAEATSSINSTDIQEDQVSKLTGEISYDNIDTHSGALNFASFGVDVGLGNNLGGHGKGKAAKQIVPPSRVTDTGKFATNDFVKVHGNYSRLQTLTDTQTLLVRLEGQQSNSLLPPIEQFSIGGPTSVRGYPVSEHLVDTGAFASFEWTLNVPGMLGFGDSPAIGGRTWGEVLRVSFFSDWAWGQVNDPTAIDESSAAFLGVGAGVQFSLPGEFTGRVQVARPVGTGIKNDLNPSGEPSDGNLVRWWFDLTYTF